MPITDLTQLLLLFALAALGVLVLPWRSAEQTRVVVAWLSLGRWLAQPARPRPAWSRSRGPASEGLARS